RRPGHIHSERMLIRVEQGKAQKDRYTLLSPPRLQELRAYWREYRPGEWRFPNPKRNGPILRGTAQHVFYNVTRRAGLLRGHGIPTLRHCFAMHLLEAVSICAPFNSCWATRTCRLPASIFT